MSRKLIHYININKLNKCVNKTCTNLLKIKDKDDGMIHHSSVSVINIPIDVSAHARYM